MQERRPPSSPTPSAAQGASRGLPKVPTSHSYSPPDPTCLEEGGSHWKVTVRRWRAKRPPEGQPQLQSRLGSDYLQGYGKQYELLGK